MNSAKKIITGITALITVTFGWIGWLIILYCTVMVIDYLTGTAVAIKEKRWRSSVARKGLWIKFGSIIAILVSALTDFLLWIMINNLPAFKLPFEYSVLICPIVLIWYIITELGSIIENAAKMGAPIHPSLRLLLNLIKKSSEISNSNKKK